MVRYCVISCLCCHRNLKDWEAVCIQICVNAGILSITEQPNDSVMPRYPILRESCHCFQHFIFEKIVAYVVLVLHKG